MINIYLVNEGDNSREIIETHLKETKRHVKLTDNYDNADMILLYKFSPSEIDLHLLTDLAIRTFTKIPIIYGRSSIEYFESDRKFNRFVINLGFEIKHFQSKYNVNHCVFNIPISQYELDNGVKEVRGSIVDSLKDIIDYTEIIKK